MIKATRVCLPHAAVATATALVVVVVVVIDSRR